MDDNRYEYLVRRFELDAHHSPATFRSKVLLVSSLAYVALALVLLLVIALGFTAFYWLRDSRNVWVMIHLGLFALFLVGLLYTVLRAFLTRLSPPEGREITRAEAPKLFELIDRIQRKQKGPPLHRVVVDRSFNAAIAQVPRFGLFGGHRNHLILGLPYLYAMAPREMAATLAHEYGHLSGAHGKLGAWVYRQRLTFGALMDKVSGSEGNWLDSLLHTGLRRFAPYFNAYTFVLSRQDEYQADAAAGRTVGHAAAATGLCRGELLADWIDEAFWPRLYAQAAHHPKPLFPPYSSMRTAFSASHLDWCNQERLNAALLRKSSLDDTHPCLRDRLEALEIPPSLPAPVEKSAAEALLGNFAHALAKEFDQAWWEEEKSAWLTHHREQRDSRQRIAELSPRPLESLSPFELQEYGGALVNCDRAAEALPVFKHLLQRPDGPFPRARMHYGRLLMEAGDMRGVDELAQAALEDHSLAERCLQFGYVFLCRKEGEEEAERWAEALTARLG